MEMTTHIACGKRTKLKKKSTTIVKQFISICHKNIKIGQDHSLCVKVVHFIFAEKSASI